MATTQNLELITNAWTQIPISDTTVTIEATDRLFLFWTEGPAPTSSDRGHILDSYRLASVSDTETLWVSSSFSNLPTTVIYTESV